MLEECPHCHAMVLFMSERRCPACQKFADNPTGATPHLTRVTVRAGDVLPALCVGCGHKTDRQKRLASARTIGGEDGPVTLLLVLAGFFKPRLWVHLWSHRGESQQVDATYFQCESCSRGEPVRPVYTDFARRTVVLLVHRAIKTAMTAASPTR
jgi:hypothetical protein